MLPETGIAAARDPLIQTTLEQSGLPLKDDLTIEEIKVLTQWAVHGKSPIRALRETLLYAVTDSELREAAQAGHLIGDVRDFRNSTSAFDSLEETGIVVAQDNGHHVYRHNILSSLYQATTEIWSARDPQPDEMDESLAAAVRSIAAYRARLEKSRDLDEFFQDMRHLWTIVRDCRETPDFYLLLEGAHPNDPEWISFTGERGDLRVLRAREVPEPILAALEISRAHRFASVLTDESAAVIWSAHEGPGGPMRLFARVPRKNHSFNETSLRHWTNLMLDTWKGLAFLATHEYGVHRLQRSNDLRIDKRSVFIVHGHDLKAFQEVHDQLKVHKLKAITWEDAKRYTHKTVPSNLETVQAGLEHAYAITVLMTGDDVGKLARLRKIEDYAPQPRQNVLIEAGMAMAMNPNRTILVHFGDIRQASDFAGLNVVEYDYTPEAREKLAEAFGRAGCINGVLPKRSRRGAKR